MNEVIQTLQNFGLNVNLNSSPVEATWVLMKADTNKLLDAFSKLSSGASCAAGGTVLRTTAAYALVYAVENDMDSIDQGTVDLAQKRATELLKGMKTEETKRTRTPQLRGEMLQYIQDNPDYTKQQVVDEFLSRYPEKSINTLTQYYHSSRKEAGLKPNGQLGRRKGDTLDQVTEIVAKMIKDNPKVGVPELKEAVLNDPDISLSPSSVQVYVYRARSNIKT